MIGCCRRPSWRSSPGGRAIADPVAARAAGLELAGPDGALVVCGSLYLLHDLAERLVVAG